MPVTPDASWGRVIFRYGNGVYNHTGSFHIGALSGTPPVYPFTFVTAGPVATVAAIFETYIKPLFAGLYPAGWSIGGFDVFKNNGSLPETFVGSGLLTDVVGSTVAPIVPTIQVTYNFKTALNDAAKVIFLDTNVNVSPKTLAGGLSAVEQTFITNWATDTNIRGHDGQQVTIFRDRTVTVNRRLHRHYGYA